MTHPIERITQKDPNYPAQLKGYLSTDAPETIWAQGNIALLTDREAHLNGNLWALFCSSRCPGQVILKSHELAQQFRASGRPTIGGYHSPIEKECLRVLLRGSQPIILCPARSIENMRLNPAWKEGLAEGRLLLLSIFDSKHRRSTAGLANQRNAFVAALADKICIAHASEGSKTLQFAHQISEWGKPLFTFDTLANRPLFQCGAQRIEDFCT
ncbi:DNA-processing protein DprA [Candidatus Poribacteria bacterium]|nr:DNA-processing protein DprA [Candidatus Poribacteria bacterium]